MASFRDKTAVIDGERRFTYAELYERCVRLASALADRGVGRLDTVAILASNVPEMIEAHFAVPMLGAVLNPLNTRLDAATIAFSLNHGQAKVLIVDREFAGLVAIARHQFDHEVLVVDIENPGLPDAPALRRHHLRGTAGRRRSALSNGKSLTTSGSPFACSTRRGRPAIQKAPSIVIAAPTCRRSATR